MSDKDLLREYKNTITDLTKDKKELTDTIEEKDSRINKLIKMCNRQVKRLQNLRRNSTKNKQSKE